MLQMSYMFHCGVTNATRATDTTVASDATVDVPVMIYKANLMHCLVNSDVVREDDKSEYTYQSSNILRSFPHVVFPLHPGSKQHVPDLESPNSCIFLAFQDLDCLTDQQIRAPSAIVVLLCKHFCL